MGSHPKILTLLLLESKALSTHALSTSKYLENVKYTKHMTEIVTK